MMSLKEESGRFMFHFSEIFEKMYRIHRKIPHSFQNSLKKWYILEEILLILGFIFWSLPDHMYDSGAFAGYNINNKILDFKNLLHLFLHL